LPKDDFYTPTDIDALRMENELLTFEVRYLKTRLAEVERLEKRLAEAEQEAERAEKDLVLLLRSMARGPLGPFVKLKHSFRTLERRYLRDDA
jgi:hypothetical protein